MGHSEDASASIGIRIKISDLVLQMTTANMNAICGFLSATDGHALIEDENGEWTTKCCDWVNQEDESEENPTKKAKVEKANEVRDKYEIELKQIKENGECLWDQFLLYPCQTILKTSRYGSNGTSCAIPDFQEIIAKITKKYKWLQNHQIVFIQSIG